MALKKEIDVAYDISAVIEHLLLEQFSPKVLSMGEEQKAAMTITVPFRTQREER